jgi:peptidoglycan L-alanyl-D-glutamate endopeptidase CwlK
MITLSQRSERCMLGIHPDLIEVIRAMAQLSTDDFTIICGLRTLKEQEHLVSIGASTTMKSRHLTGHAFDWAPIVSGKLSWDVKDYLRVIPMWKEAAKSANVTIESGGDWIHFKDYPHIQLPWKLYPVVGGSHA